MMTERLIRQPHSILFAGSDTWLPDTKALLLNSPARILETCDPSEVPSLMEQVEVETRRGRYVAGFLSYEAGRAFGLETHPHTGETPIAWFASYEPENVRPVDLAKLRDASKSPAVDKAEVRLDVTRDDYTSGISRIKDLIASGDTYQVNYTCRARFGLDADPVGYFAALVRSHPVPYAAYLDLGNEQLLSISPELFLQKRGDMIESRPMKGTRKRGRTLDEDRELSREMVDSEKDRAENVMILDMMRNDLGRICRFGSVRALSMFLAEKYRSVWQMTSTVVGELRPGVTIGEVFAATFPASSITGAPKRRTMEIIRDLEKAPRGVYTGAICLFQPNSDFTCSVAIRTLAHKDGEFELGIGSGIVWDSDPQSEYEETLLKSTFALRLHPDLRLFETILCDQSGRLAFEDEHLDRMASSAEYWDFPFERRQAKTLLRDYAASGENPAIVRMDLDSGGALAFVRRQLPPPPHQPAKLLLSQQRTSSTDKFLFHKTTERGLYDQARSEAVQNGFFEVIFRNEADNVTEGAITNIFLRFGDQWVTPSLNDGLLPGVWRAEFLKQTNAVERSITISDIRKADEISIGNSVRGAIPVGEIYDEQTGVVLWKESRPPPPVPCTPKEAV